MKKFVKKTEGFTLVELIVVIAILGILAGVGTVGYSGYIDKANMAADQQLVAAINQAYAIACVENGVNAAETTASNITIGDDKTVAADDIVVSGEKGDAIEAAFAKYFAGNESASFKVAETLEFRKDKGGVFVADFDLAEGGAYADLFNALKEQFADDIADKILTSNLGEIGTEALFGQMNNAMNMAGELNLHNLTGEPFANAYFEYLGIDLSDYATDEEAQDAFDAKLDDLGVDDATAATHAIALYAAQNSAGLTIESVSSWLGSGKDTDDLQKNPNANTLAQAAAIYGMYLSYQKDTTGSIPTDSTLDIMTDALTDSAFATWVSTNDKAQAELDAYKTYMEIINEAAKDGNARDEILANGFTNPELESLVKELIGK